ncbi:uncharacterized protein LOC131073387 [Cryptomeria japonica]|uniref:uncharacterized protein LOC131073387 n=1 Tax=Cryptomeria japonica TaxID=3369 RepID=UPI0027D9F3AD|nr:uncharacterized protein LOC131073387 [Cryptomeria japonica]
MARQRSSKLMECLACPLSKESLRFCAKSNTLINDSMGVSYPFPHPVVDIKLCGGIDYLFSVDWALFYPMATFLWSFLYGTSICILQQ